MENNVKPTMGSMQNGIASPYDFSIKTLLMNAWDGVKGFKASFFGAIAYTFLILILLSILFAVIEVTMSNVFGIDKTTTPQAYNALQQLCNTLVTVLMLPMVVGLMMLGVRRSVQLPIHAKQVFNYWSFFWAILGVYIVQNIILVVLGFLAGVFWGLGMAASALSVVIFCDIIGAIFGIVFVYLAISYSFAMLIKVEKKLSIWGALEASRKAVSQHWFKVVGTFIVMGVCTVLSIVPGIILWIWVLPMMYLVLGGLYITMFGVEEMR